MTHKEQIQNAIIKELRICQRLFTLLPKDSYDYRPQEGMRSTLELLQSITFWASWSIESYLTAEKEVRKTLFDKYNDHSKTMKPEDFIQRMDEQIEQVNELMKDISDEDLLNKKVILRSGEEVLLGQMIIDASLKWPTGYKMQLFLYAKMSGLKELHTGDAWVSQYGDDEESD